MNCLFCNFATGKIKKEFVLETNSVMVFSDIYPVAPLHLLVVPKKHVSEFTGMEKISDVWSEMMAVVLKLIKQNGLEKKGYRIVINGGGAQAIDHLHVHLQGGVSK